VDSSGFSALSVLAAMIDQEDLFDRLKGHKPMQDEQKPISISLMALQGHWLRADAVKQRMLTNVEQRGKGPELPDDLEAIGQHESKVMMVTVFYGLIYVVVEGYRELQLKNETIDALLANGDFVDHLRRFRNAVFHFQNVPLDERLVKFFATPDSEVWIRELFRAFDRFLMKELPVVEDLQRMIKGETSSAVMRGRLFTK
jgi:hypothetical protein